MRAPLSIGLICVAASCSPIHSSNTATEIIDTEKIMSTDIHGQGRIVWNDFEGGFYGIIDENGTKYFPLHPLDQNLQVDGITVKFVLRSKADIATIVMWGTPVSVIRIEKLDP